ncbi:predicted protein [Nematostella vectensis]|uniref:Peptidase S54 rhomboid domain-containing protein n=1 Tax=Nematostella vectensis TaxID=45351 RepID=A7T1C1_NEMVE|nr:predicted protein [Nematostella vectensis]|eukprot:XP_001622342.1 predicted protein [Nematostella vectensis]
MQRRGRGGLGIFLLLAQLYNFGFNRIPPVTLSFIAGNAAIYLRLLPNLPRLRDACVSANHVWYYGDWLRLALAPFFHLDDWHLYYNMASFLWKGKSLETKLGSGMFLYLLAVFSVLTSVVLVGLDIFLANVTGDSSYLYSCAAGFSGVIFALKVLTTYELPSGVSMVMGMFPIPVRYACWAELILIQLMVPNASFTGHLAGIIVGLLYVKGPLKSILNILPGIDVTVISCMTCIIILLSARHPNDNSASYRRPPYPHHAPEYEPPPPYSEAANERLYPRIPDSSLPSAPPYSDSGTLPYPVHGTMPTPDDIRQRRLRRFKQ